MEALMKMILARQEKLEMTLNGQEMQLSFLGHQLQGVQFNLEKMIALLSSMKSDEGCSRENKQEDVKQEREDLSFTGSPETLITEVARVLGHSSGNGKATYVGENLCVIRFPDGVEHHVGERVDVYFPVSRKTVGTVIIGKKLGGCDALVVEGQESLPDAFDLDVRLFKESGRVMIASLREDGTAGWCTGVYTEVKPCHYVLSEVTGSVTEGDAVFTCRRDGVVRFVGVVKDDRHCLDTDFMFRGTRIREGIMDNEDVLKPLGVVYVVPDIKYDYYFGPDD